jgi:hypothetical protein
MFAPLGVAAPPLLGDRTPIGAGLLLERRARFLIFPQLAPIFRDRLRRCRLCPGITSTWRRTRARIDRRRRLDDQQQCQRKISGTGTNRMREHWIVVASVPRKSAPKR